MVLPQDEEFIFGNQYDGLSGPPLPGSGFIDGGWNT
jgi:hypothetical protein